MHEMCIDADNITCPCQSAGVVEIPKEALMSPGIKAVVADHMHGAMAGLSAITVGAYLLTVQTYRVDDVTTRVQVNRRPPDGPLVFTIRLTEGAA
jgi:hypothetical protein